jgi:hypothetical protein
MLFFASISGIDLIKPHIILESRLAVITIKSVTIPFYCDRRCRRLKAVGVAIGDEYGMIHQGVRQDRGQSRPSAWPFAACVFSPA